jgi:hypothetical protein
MNLIYELLGYFLAILFSFAPRPPELSEIESMIKRQFTISNPFFIIQNKLPVALSLNPGRRKHHLFFLENKLY